MENGRIRTVIKRDRLQEQQIRRFPAQIIQNTGDAIRTDKIIAVHKPEVFALRGIHAPVSRSADAGVILTDHGEISVLFLVGAQYFSAFVG